MILNPTSKITNSNFITVINKKMNKTEDSNH